MPTIWDIPSDPKAIRAKIRHYERALEKEREQFGSYNDGAGKRFLLGGLYLAMGDDAGARRSFEWFEDEFPDSSDDALQCLCWALSLHRNQDDVRARQKLCATMLENRFLLPRLLGDVVENEAASEPFSVANERYYATEVPEKLLELWSAEELAWCRAQYEGAVFAAVRERFYELERMLEQEPIGPRRTAMVDECFALRRGGGLR